MRTEVRNEPSATDSVHAAFVAAWAEPSWSSYTSKLEETKIASAGTTLTRADGEPRGLRGSKGGRWCRAARVRPPLVGRHVAIAAVIRLSARYYHFWKVSGNHSARDILSC